MNETAALVRFEVSLDRDRPGQRFWGDTVADRKVSTSSPMNEKWAMRTAPLTETAIALLVVPKSIPTEGRKVTFRDGKEISDLLSL